RAKAMRLADALRAADAQIKSISHRSPDPLAPGVPEPEVEVKIIIAVNLSARPTIVGMPDMSSVDPAATGATAPASPAAEAAVPFFRKRARRTGGGSGGGGILRKRDREGDEGGDDEDGGRGGGGGAAAGDNGDDGSVVQAKRRGNRAGILASSASSTASDAAVAAALAASAAAGGGDAAAQAHVAFAASGTAANLSQDMATRTLDIDGNADAEAAAGTDGAVGKILAGDEAEGAGLYRGLGKYKEYVNKKVEKVTQSNAGGIRAGPLRASTNVRISSRFDYQPHVCKDYKETGNCGYGDSCIYLHDRGDYKMGWQLDLEWEEEQRRKQKEDEMRRFAAAAGIADAEEQEVDEDDDLPLDCPACGSAFRDPVITKCGHYFCEACALKQHTGAGRCLVCEAPTTGVFNAARGFKARVEAKRRRMQDRADAARAKAAELGYDEG
ncbi:hypothetical protein HK405_012493, partial [Cladochytrium tenue]